MNLQRSFLTTVVLAVLFFFNTSSLYAQKSSAASEPSGQFGLGAYINGSGQGYPPGGISFADAVNKNINIGTLFALELISNRGSSTVFQLAPFFKYLFDGPVHPFFRAALNIESYIGTMYFGIYLGGGLEYFFSHNFGIDVDCDVIGLGISPSPATTVIGFFGARMGVEWYMDK